MMKNIAIWPYKKILFSLCSVPLNYVRHPKTHLLGLAHVCLLGKWTINTKGTPYLMIQGDLVPYSCSPYSACHRVIDYVLKALTGFPRLYEQFWAKRKANTL